MKTIRGKILLTVLLVSFCSIALISAVTLFNMNELRGRVVSMSDTLGRTAGEDSSRAMEAQAMEQLTTLVRDKAAIADEKLGKQQKYVRMVAEYLTGIYSDPGRYLPRQAHGPDPADEGRLAAQLLYFNGAIDPAAVAREVALTANAEDLLMAIMASDRDMECGYFAASSGFSLTVDDISGQKAEYLDCPTRGWYQAALAEDGLVWTDVFDDAMGRGLAITCAMPYRDGAGAVRGVAAFGSLITTLNDEIIQTKIGKSGYTFVVNGQGQTIISPNIQKDENGNIIRESLLESTDPNLRTLAGLIVEGKTGVSQVSFEGRQVYMAYKPMEVLPWSVVAVMDVEEAMSVANASREDINSLTEATVADIDSSLRTVITVVILVCIAAVALAVAVGAMLAGRLTRPMGHLIQGVGRISAGDLDTQIPVETHDEIASLALAFNRMTDNLKRYISDLTAVTAEKERIGTELNVATQIQASMLPCIFPPFPDHREFDIYATMEPAKEVGGDFYDFFLVDERRLGLIIADVSGKGVPAALFMVIAKTLIKNHAQNGEGPRQVLSSVNNQLCENNEASMFVTAWVGVLDMETGVLTYANAGHNPPLVRHGGEGFQFLRADPGFVLAGLEDMEFSQASVTLAPGDTLFLYTDGVTEATSAAEELFGEERLSVTLDRAAGDAPVGLLAAVKGAIDDFVDGAPQFDDITMLALRFRGGEGRA